ncbi:MAG: hypothetical protein EBR02_05340 [Alphaproteobacteria bacterium]|nr:hypothetical protein [Alphaproteobacteria bacterium]
MSSKELPNVSHIPALLAAELNMLWLAHEAVGLSGYMCLYTNAEQIPFRSKTPGFKFWFSKAETPQAVDLIMEHYNHSILPNSSLLLNPIIHEKTGEDSYKPLGSGFMWATALALGVHRLQEQSSERLAELGALASKFHRGDSDAAGLKIIAFSDKVAAVSEGGLTVEGCREIYDLADIRSDQYWYSYMLSGIGYLTNNGIFLHDDVSYLFPNGAIENDDACRAMITKSAISSKRVFDSAFCWESYDRIHSLFKKFGTNRERVPQNLKFFELVARDTDLFDATGPMRKGAEEMFEFIVPGLIPRGAVTLLGATGGTGKSSAAHHLCVLSSIDYEPGEEAPRWLGQRVAVEKTKGICIYFSGEDGPPIINARASIFDPDGRAQRLMFQRTDFGDGVTFAQHLKRLHKIPNVPLMVIDPARKYLTGDEDDSGVVSDFFEAIEEFAITKNCAVVVVHHLQKGANPKSTREVLDLLRGSQVFIDRPRVVIGMFREGPYAVAGLAKNNIPPTLGMMTEERVFARDPKKLQLVWLPGKEGVRDATLSEEELEQLANEAQLKAGQ